MKISPKRGNYGMKGVFVICSFNKELGEIARSLKGSAGNGSHGNKKQSRPSSRCLDEETEAIGTHTPTAQVKGKQGGKRSGGQGGT